MTMWQAGDVAVAVKDVACGCGEHSIQRRKYYRVMEITRPDWGGVDDVFLSVTKPQGHFYHHTCFRREQKADTDIFKLASAPTPAKKLENVE